MAYKSVRKKRRHTLLFVCSVILCTALCGSFFFLNQYHSDILYRIQKDFFSLTAKNPLSKAQVTTVHVSLRELLSDPRCNSDQSLMLINQEYPLPRDFSADISFYKNSDVQMNTCLQDAYAALSAAVEEKYGERLYIRDAYRSAEEQEQKHQEKGKIAASVGASEHQAGLALDVYVPQFAGWSFVKSEAGRFVDEHCQEYGLIVRYPSYGIKETGIEYEPWHLRYVGTPHAQIIMDGYMTLEEYMKALEPGKLYQYGNYLISRQSGDVITVPVVYESMTVSEDNMGGYIFTWLTGA